MRFVLSTFVLFALLLPFQASAASIGVSPERIQVNLEQREESVQNEFSVFNTGDHPAIYKLSVEGYEKLISFSPRRFRLESGASRAVTMTLNRFPPGEFETNIRVVAEDIPSRRGIKAGMKLPLTITSAPTSGGNVQIEAVIVGLLLLGFLLFLGSIWLYSRRSWWSRGVDRVTETALSGHPKAMMKHYRNKHILMVVALVLVVLAFILLLASLIVPYFFGAGQDQPVTASRQAEQVRLVIRSPNETISARPDFSEAKTPLQALKIFTGEKGISLDYDDSSQMGVFVTEINGTTNGKDGKYWVYEINGKTVPKAADQKQIRPGDEVLWKFVSPDET